MSNYIMIPVFITAAFAFLFIFAGTFAMLVFSVRDVINDIRNYTRHKKYVKYNKNSNVNEPMYKCLNFKTEEEYQEWLKSLVFPKV